MSENRNKRLNILSKAEIEEIYGIPNFSYEDRICYFHLSEKELEEKNKFNKPFIQIYFILCLGYFKAKRNFFIINEDNSLKDIEYVRETYFYDNQDIKYMKVSRASISIIKNRVLFLCGYSLCTSKIKRELKERAFYLTKIYTKPSFILKELFTYLEDVHNGCSRLFIFARSYRY